MYNLQQEDEKYSWLFENNYGNGPIESIVSWVKRRGVLTNSLSILDAGCGRGTLRNFIPHFRNYIGIDVASAQIFKNKKENFPNCQFIHGSISKIPFKDDHFDICFCIDVLEHLPEHLIDQTLQELIRVAPICALSICYRPSRSTGENGENLHLTLQPPEWWEEKVEKYVQEKALRGKNKIFYIKQQLSPPYDPESCLFLCGELKLLTVDKVN